ncbi:hypothetical protein SAMN05421505_115100 [Sinosporangium album]|uniref:Uncharacterized protein n=1 Tax=Sinosporangium album TaxID=504805 RepID=A0A1G8C8V3_9ACTN|nr:hypothetical protein SAMN05421505_115100 [Sinosporangium album]
MIDQAALLAEHAVNVVDARAERVELHTWSHEGYGLL